MENEKLHEEVLRESMYQGVVLEKLRKRICGGPFGDVVMGAITQANGKVSVLRALQMFLNEDVQSLGWDPNERTERLKIGGGVNLEFQAIQYPFCVVAHGGDEKLFYAIDAVIQDLYPNEPDRSSWWIANREETKEFRQEKVE